MFYFQNKKVKEWIVKGSGNDTFLHRVKSATIDNREFYSGDVSDSEFVDVKVYYKGSRIKTTPQFVRKTQLSSTTITVDLRSEYTLKVLSSISSDVTNFSGTANQNPSFKLASTVTSSTVIIYLVPESNIVSTGFYSCILDDTNFTNVSGSDVYSECTFDNAMMYMMDYSGAYNLHKVYSIRAFPQGFTNNNDVGYIDFIVADPPETGTIVNSEGLHFGYLPQQTAEAMGFTSEGNPNGTSKESPDYWGWGCWTDDQWFWSDDELREIFCSDSGDYVRAEDTLDTFIGSTSLSLVNTLHWGIYDLDSSIIEASSGEIEDGRTKFMDAWIFDHDGESLLSPLVSLTETTLADKIAAYFPSPQGTITLFVPFSQPALEGGMSYLYDCLLQQGLTTDIRSHADNFFNITNQLPEPISGIFTTNVSVSDGYMYVAENLDQVQHASSENAVTVDSTNKCIYVGARKKDSTLTVTFNSSVSSDIFSSVYFNHYKLIPFIANEGSSISTDGTINLK